MVVLLNSIGPVAIFFGRQVDRALKEDKSFEGFLNIVKGSALRVTRFSTLLSVDLNINLLLSNVPKRFDTAGKLVFLIFSNKIAGPFASKTLR